VGVAGVIYGAIVARQSGRWAEVLGLVAFLGYLGVVTTGNFAHNYYQLPLVPPAICAMALGLTTAVERIGQRRRWTPDRLTAALAAVVWLAALTTFIRAASAHSWYEVADDRVHICDELVRTVPPSRRLAFLHYGSPDLLFCTDRKGWILQDSEVEPRRLAELLDRNAVIVVETRFPETVRVLEQLGTPVASTPGFVAYGRKR
jgi:hypothetical protein